MSEIPGMMIEGMTICGADAEHLKVQVLLYLEVGSSRGRVAAQLGFEERESKLNGVQVWRVRG